MIIGIEDGNTVSRQTAVNLALGGGNAVHRAKTFHMSRLDIVNQGDVRLRHRTEVSDFTGTAGTHFHHCELHPGFQRQQCQWYADLVVQVALRGQGSTPLREHRVQHVLYGGLATTAGNCHQRTFEQGAVIGSQPPQRPQRIGDAQLGQRHSAN